jgi:hypothetical protein
MSALGCQAERELKERKKGKRAAVVKPRAHKCKKLRPNGHCDDHPLDRCVNVPHTLCDYVPGEG